MILPNYMASGFAFLLCIVSVNAVSRGKVPDEHVPLLRKEAAPVEMTIASDGNLLEQAVAALSTDEVRALEAALASRSSASRGPPADKPSSDKSSSDKKGADVDKTAEQKDMAPDDKSKKSKSKSTDKTGTSVDKTASEKGSKSIKTNSSNGTNTSNVSSSDNKTASPAPSPVPAQDVKKA